MKQPITFAIWNRPPPKMGWPHDRVLSWVKRRIFIGTLAPVSLSNAFSISKAECCDLCCDLVLVAWKCWWRWLWIGPLYMLFIASGSLTRSAFPSQFYIHRPILLSRTRWITLWWLSLSLSRSRSSLRSPLLNPVATQPFRQSSVRSIVALRNKISD